MSVQLLDKTRKIKKLLHNNDSRMVVFNDICGGLSEILDSNIIVLSKKGKVLGIKNRDDIPAIQELIKDNVGSYRDCLVSCQQKKMLTSLPWALNSRKLMIIRLSSFL